MISFIAYIHMFTVNEFEDMEKEKLRIQQEMLSLRFFPLRITLAARGEA